MRACLVIALLFELTCVSRVAAAQNASPPSETRQSLNDTWWTGPMLAASASTLPRGHVLLEPYLFDVIVLGRFDRDGARRDVPRAHGVGSLTYMLYGLTDRFTAGLIPTAGFNMRTGTASSSGPGMGDLTLSAQYRLSQFRPGHRIPTISVVLQETLPTGKYHRLDRGNDGFGSGAHTTKLALYLQHYFWLPNERILRTRLDVSHAFSNSVYVEDVSVYGTEKGFRGRAHPGSSFFIDSSWEYSLKRNLVLALDVTYGHDRNTRVIGRNISLPDPPRVQFDSGSRDAFGLAPAIEYSWNANIGVLLGVRIIPAGRNVSATVTPAIAINYVR
jgi:Putative MetA-pathway of phenol degradation